MDDRNALVLQMMHNDFYSINAKYHGIQETMSPQLRISLSIHNIYHYTENRHNRQLILTDLSLLRPGDVHHANALVQSESVPDVPRPVPGRRENAMWEAERETRRKITMVATALAEAIFTSLKKEMLKLVLFDSLRSVVHRLI
jgi:hypothetical protein